MNNIDELLKYLQINLPGTYDNHFYVIKMDTSDEYAVMYSKLDSAAINTEYPSLGINSNKNLKKVTNYFEIDYENTSYNLFLIADFDNNEYKLKIGEQ